jgi:hypothetical protein
MLVADECRAGVKQPSVEIRFDDLCASAMAPEGSTEGLFTVGVDLKVKALVRILFQSRKASINCDFVGFSSSRRFCCHLKRVYALF